MLQEMGDEMECVCVCVCVCVRACVRGLAREEKMELMSSVYQGEKEE